MHQMPEEHVAVLHTVCRSIDEGNGAEDLPQEVVKRYWEFKRVFDRMGAQLADRDLAMVAIGLGYGKPLGDEGKPPGVVELWRSKQIGFDTPILVQWRNKSQPGLLKDVTASGKVLVQMDCDQEERHVEPEKVSIPTAAAV